MTAAEQADDAFTPGPRRSFADWCRLMVSSRIADRVTWFRIVRLPLPRIRGERVGLIIIKGK